MTKVIAVATALLLGTSGLALAQSSTGGASPTSPGNEMQNSTGTSKGAAEYSPGDRMRDKGTVGQSRGTNKGASPYAPGTTDKRNKY